LKLAPSLPNTLLKYSWSFQGSGFAKQVKMYRTLQLMISDW
jgi:hypothetical protein